MGRLNPLDNEGARERVAEIFGEIEGAFGMVPNLFRTYAHHPPLLEANWAKVKALMMGGVLDRKLKEAIAVAVSLDNSCDYCVAAHTMALRSIGVGEDEIKNIEEDVDGTSFSAKEKALLKFARRANSDPLRITEEEFAVLRSAGASDQEVVEALGVMELFTSFNKFLDSLQVAIDF